MDYTHAPIRVIDEAIASGELTVAAARKLLKARIATNGEDSKSGRNAARWLQAHKTTRKAEGPKDEAPKATPKAVAEAKDEATLRAQELRAQAWKMRCEAKDAGEKLTYAEACEILGVAPAKASK